MDDSQALDLISFYHHCNNDPDLPRSYMTDIYYTTLQCLYQLDKATRQALTDLFQFERHPSRTVLQRANHPSKKLWLIHKGLVCCKSKPPTKYRIEYFHFKGELIGHYNSYILNKSYPMSLEVIHDVECWSVNIKELFALRAQNNMITPFFDLSAPAKNFWVELFIHQREKRLAAPYINGCNWNIHSTSN